MLETSGTGFLVQHQLKLNDSILAYCVKVQLKLNPFFIFFILRVKNSEYKMSHLIQIQPATGGTRSQIIGV